MIFYCKNRSQYVEKETGLAGDEMNMPQRKFFRFINGQSVGFLASQLILFLICQIKCSNSIDFSLEKPLDACCDVVCRIAKNVFWAFFMILFYICLLVSSNETSVVSRCFILFSIYRSIKLFFSFLIFSDEIYSNQVEQSSSGIIFLS